MKTDWEIRMLTQEEQATNYRTMRHIERVRNLINTVVLGLLERGEFHDQTKLSSPEVEIFTQKTPQLAAMVYGSLEYKRMLDEMAEALTHHYVRNRHHPEHFKNGANDMNILDIVEMLCDWKASSERHNDGNLRQSIEKNANRFSLSPQLVAILNNSIELFE